MSELSPVVKARDMEFAPTLSRSLWARAPPRLSCLRPGPSGAARPSSHFSQFEPDPPHCLNIAFIRVRFGQLRAQIAHMDVHRVLVP